MSSRQLSVFKPFGGLIHLQMHSTKQKCVRSKISLLLLARYFLHVISLCILQTTSVMNQVYNCNMLYVNKTQPNACIFILVVTIIVLKLLKLNLIVHQPYFNLVTLWYMKSRYVHIFYLDGLIGATNKPRIWNYYHPTPDVLSYAG